MSHFVSSLAKIHETFCVKKTLKHIKNNALSNNTHSKQKFDIFITGKSDMQCCLSQHTFFSSVGISLHFQGLGDILHTALILAPKH